MKISYYKVLIFSCLLIINILLKDSTLSFALTGLQVVFVLQLLLRNRIQDAAYWHIIFMITCFAVSGDEDEFVIKSGYFSTKLVGPLTLSYLVGILIYLCSLKRTKTNMDGTLFKKMYKYFGIFLLMGVTIGGVGCIASDYFLKSFVGYIIYIIMVLIHIGILINVYSDNFLQKCFESALPLFMAALISTVFNWMYGFTHSYSIYDMVDSSPIANFSILLILYLSKFSFKEKILVIVLLFIYLYILILTGAPGKFFLNVSIIALVYVVNRIRHKGFGLIPALGIIAVAVTFASGSMMEDSMFYRKFEQFRSLGSLSSGKIEKVGSSPYIRVASMLDIYNENLKNPIYFLVGRGYGGYFQDDLHLFTSYDLSAGAFSDEAVEKGKYPTAHSTLNTVPLLHGFGGLVLVLLLVIKYFKRSLYQSPLSLIGVLWLFFMFYYNIQTAIVGVFFLYSSEFEIKNSKLIVLNGTHRKKNQ